MELLKSVMNWSLNWRWCPTSPADLENVEKRMLAPVKSKLTDKMVDVGKGNVVRTLIVGDSSGEDKNIPLVLVHGFGGGVGVWVKNLDHLSHNRPVYAFDLLGFGRSSRPKFDKNPEVAEEQFVESIESWRREMGLQKFILLGHSLGAYLATSYSIKFPSHVEHLILADPWGFPEQLEKSDPMPQRAKTLPWWIRSLVRVMDNFTPLAGLRVAGPWGPGLVGRFRPDFKRKYESVFEDDTILEYIYHCNVQLPSGEHAYKAMSKSWGWAKRPMIQRAHQLDHNIPVTMVYGSRTWMDISIGEKMKELRSCSYVDVHIVDKAGHHVFSDQSSIFNAIVAKVCDSIHKDLKEEEQ
eukprot:m.309628 g.309628  ORF g.309628 m.309628 type:complete len:353 (+) comp47137_c0_seq1:26-1084(+)